MLAGAIGITLDALLILAFAALAYRAARARRFVEHRRWALRLFAVASAVWFMRVAYMAWGMATGGAGIGKALDGPFDLFPRIRQFADPARARRAPPARGDARHPGGEKGVAVLLGISGLVILAGSTGAWMMMWGPYI